MPTTRKEIIKELKELIEIPLTQPELYDELGIIPTRAILLYGVTGTGKTYMLKQITKEAKVSFESINLEGSTPKELLEKLEKITKTTKPVVIYLVMHNPEGISHKVITTLSKILDGETTIDLTRTIIAGSSVRPNLPQELRRPGRFDRELQVNLPNEEERLEILQFLSKKTKLSNSVKLGKIAQMTRGYTPADLMLIFQTAAQYSIRRKLEHSKPSNTQDQDLYISQKDLVNSIKIIIPTVYKEFGLIRPNLDLNDLKGHDEIKKIIIEKVVLPIKHAEYYQKLNAGNINGILLYGPPGNGKTTIAKAIATAVNAHFLYVNSSELIGSTKNEKSLSQIFEVAYEVEPTVIFFDEVDSILLSRKDASTEVSALVNEFLVSMDGVGSSPNTLVIAATNFADRIDEAALRPGRLQLKIFIAPPNLKEREDVFSDLTTKLKLEESLKMEYLAQKTNPNDEGHFNFADLHQIVRDASAFAAQDAISKQINPNNIIIMKEHFDRVFSQIKPSLMGYDPKFYDPKFDLDGEKSLKSLLKRMIRQYGLENLLNMLTQNERDHLKSLLE
ncbi:MAG: AAA family ATPase [Candidatus Heimdallarchaeota archaeon]|nr:AAA family ATPase [Candidatus Heimdallarchaeota archaeon]